MSRRYTFDPPRSGKYGDSGLLDMENPMTANVVAGAVGVAAGAVLMHFAMKHNWLGLGRPAAAAPQVPATTGTAAPAASAGVTVGNYR